MTVYVDQDRIVYEFENGPNEERRVIAWNVRDPVPGKYKFTEKGEFDDWERKPAWTRHQNFIDPTNPAFGSWKMARHGS